MHWLYTLWYGYAWPSLKGNGPEAVIQTVAYGAIALALVPVVRRFIRAEAALARGELHKAEEFAKAEERKVVALVKRFLKSPAKAIKAVSRVRVTVKEVKAVDAVGIVAETVDPALAPAVKDVEGAAAKAEATTTAGDIMGAK